MRVWWLLFTFCVSVPQSPSFIYIYVCVCRFHFIRIVWLLSIFLYYRLRVYGLNRAKCIYKYTKFRGKYVCCIVVSFFIHFFLNFPALPYHHVWLYNAVADTCTYIQRDMRTAEMHIATALAPHLLDMFTTIYTNTYDILYLLSLLFARLKLASFSPHFSCH